MTQIIAKSTFNTTCPYCGVGCGVEAQVENGRLVSVKGLSSHPANEGRLCVKGSSLHETLADGNRLLYPQVNGERVSWETALDTVAEKFKQTIAEHGPDSVAFYLSGQLLTEDYYIANKLMKGFIGTANIDTNSRLCMASPVISHKRAFGADSVPTSYYDLENAEVIFIVGSNTAYAHPIVFQRIVKAQKEKGIKVVVVDPRRTATCDIADLHLPIAPGSDGYFYNGLLRYLAVNDKLDRRFIDAHTDNFESALAAATEQTPDLESVAQHCDISLEILKQAYEMFASHEKVMTLFSMGINQSSSGVDKGNAIINCHLATGKIGKEGAAPFSITGQPNAMGGREVGGLANQLAAHMAFTEDDIQTVKEFWQAPNMAEKPGLKAVDMFDALDEGKIKAIWVMATNPVVSMPNADKVKRALENCEFVVVSDCMGNTDTVQTANVKLPATGWSEKHGTVTNSERRISLQRGIVKPLGESRHDWDIMCDFARRMGFSDGFNYTHQYEIFAEHARLSGYKNVGQRAFNISALSDISKEQYEQFTPVQWPVTDEFSQGKTRLFEDGQFFTDNRRAKFIAINAQPPKQKPDLKMVNADSKAPSKQVVLNTGRIRDQWHTMTRTGLAARLLSHRSEPFVEVHPQDAHDLGIKNHQLIELKNLGSRFVGRAHFSEGQRRAEVFVPMHWNRVFASQGRIDALVAPVLDPYSGQPEFKHCPVNMFAYREAWQGILVCQEEVTPQCDYWSKTTEQTGFAYQLADRINGKIESDWLSGLFPNITDWVSLSDSQNQSIRFAGFMDEKLSAVLITDVDPNKLPSAQWLVSQLGETFEDKSRFSLLAGADSDPANQPGAIVCSCYQVGENAIKNAIQEGCQSVEALGQRLKCGTNCGSCIPELSGFIDAAKSSN